MKPFDLELVKAGHPVCTRDGRDVRIICFDMKNYTPIAAIAKVDSDDHERIRLYYNDGRYWEDREPCSEDLFMKENEEQCSRCREMEIEIKFLKECIRVEKKMKEIEIKMLLRGP